MMSGGTQQALLEEGMRWNELSEENCSMARTVSVIGDRWTLLILRDCFLRVRRFEDFQERLGITRPILASRLKKLAESLFPGLQDRRCLYGASDIARTTFRSSK